MTPTIVKSLNLPHALIITSLGAWLRISQSFTFLLSGLAINQDPLSVVSNNRVVVKALRGFPSHPMIHKIYIYHQTFQFGSVAKQMKPMVSPTSLGSSTLFTLPVDNLILIVRFCVSHVHSEGISDLHNFDDVTHHGHFVQTRLSVKENRIAVHHVSMNNVSIVKSNGRAVHVSQRNVFTVFAFQNLGTRMYIRTILYEFEQVIAVTVVDHHGFRDIHGDLHWNSELSN